MSYAYAILIVLLLIVAILLVVFILVQQGKGAGMGASFGAGASNTLFGSSGSGNFFTKSTWFLSGLFVIICLALGYVNTHKTKVGSDYDTISTEQPKEKASVEKKANDSVDKPIVADVQPAANTQPTVENKAEKAEVVVETKVATEVKVDSESKNIAEDTKSEAADKIQQTEEK